MKEYLDFIEERYPVGDKNPGWFRPQSKPVRAWEREMKRLALEIHRQSTVAPWVEKLMQERMAGIEVKSSDLNILTPERQYG